MKKAIPILFFLTALLGFTIQHKKQLLSTIAIGKYSYKVFKQTTFVHEKHRSMDFYTVYGKNNQKQCSAVMLDMVNDSIIAKGQFSYNAKYLEFREYFTNSFRDSVIKRFYPNKAGKLILLRFIEYKNGIEKVTKY
jgi:hypothetical protein